MKLLIVNYHYYREEVYKQGIYPTSKKKLLEQVDLLSKNGYKFITVNELSEIQKNNTRYQGDKFCIITFDDGLKEQWQAYQDLSSIGVPSHYYICSSPYIEKELIDVHMIHLIRTEMTDDKIEEFLNENTNFASIKFDESLLERQYRYDELNSRKIKYFLNFVLTPSDKKKILKQLLSEISSNPAQLIKSYYFSEYEIIALDQKGLIGSHGHAHRALGSLSREDAIDDFEKSMDFLLGLGCKGLKSFSFPYGGKSAVREDIDDIMQKYNVEFAYSMNREINNHLEKPFLLNRFDTNDIFGGKFFERYKDIIL
ncbi:MAG: polysaccharide deacetylase family protein [Oligoflexia bacterium]|nr:polysaccharide deacetylase family protein [Oligoflexia bacterium]